MMDDKRLGETRRLAGLAAIPLADQRVPALAASLEFTRVIAEALARLDYGEVEPACRFRPPRSERQ